MAHHISSSKRINFVKATHEDLTAVAAVRAETKKLNGSKIADFYKELLAAGPSEIATEPNATKQRGPKKTTRRPVLPKALEPLTERDERLWFKAAAEDDLKKVEELFRRGMDLNILDLFHSSALMVAAANGSEKVLEFLVQNGADSTIISKTGFTAADLARKKGFTEIADCLNGISAQQTEATEDQTASTAGYCHECRLQFDRLEDHNCSIVHIVNSAAKPRRGFAYGIPSSNVGYQLLKETGWHESRGLGREGEGRKYPLKTVFKRDRKGLGLEKRKAQVTHFHAKDLAAVKAVPKTRELTRKEIQKLEQAEKRKEMRVRREFLENDFVIP